MTYRTVGVSAGNAAATAADEVSRPSRTPFAAAAKPATACSPSRRNSSGKWPAKSAEATTVSPELRGDLFQPRRKIHRRPDAGEIEAVAAADIAVHHLADVQREPEADRILAFRRARQFGDACPHFPRAGKRAAANRGRVGVAGDRKNRQQAVTHEFEHLAAVIEDRRHLRAEIAVQAVDQSLRRQLLGNRREAAHIRQPDRGADRFDIAAANLAGQNPLAGLMTDIGVDQIAGGAPQRANFRDPRQRRDNRFKVGKLLAGENPPGACVDHVATWTVPSVNSSGNAA